jgi:pimeloyl-ACP methyl ester carboxylesterase/DNA-binding CsgD family transcriptional regulator
VVENETGFLQFDGHRVCYATVGDGPVLVLPAWWVSHVTEDWRSESFRRFLESLAARYRVVRYDRVGTGLSDRERPSETLTLDYEIDLLEAVVDHVTDEPVSMFGLSCGSCSAAGYVVRHPGRVERLVLYGAYASGVELGPSGAREALVGLVREAWGLGSRTLADIFAPDSPAERESFGAYQQVASTARTAADLLQLTYDYDIREVLPSVEAPTLVVHRAGDRAVPLRAGRNVAALVPGAAFVTLDGISHLPWHGSLDVLAACADFLDISPPVPASPAADTEGIEELSRREREVLGLVAEGLSDADIAEKLVLSPHTVHRHVANIRRKLGLRSRSAAAAAAARAGLV